jgi:hypothetical protein
MDDHAKLMIKVRILSNGGKARVRGNPPVITEWKANTPQPTQAEFDAVTDEQIEQWLDTLHRARWDKARAERNTYTPRRG